jgi:hypothetical protein
MRVSVYHNVATDAANRVIGFFGYEGGQSLVHVFQTEMDAGTGPDSAELLAERVFEACNLAPDELTGHQRTVATAYRHRGLRSLSVGDIIIIIGEGGARVVLSVDRTGYSAVTGPLTVVTAHEHGTWPWSAPARPAPAPEAITAEHPHLAIDLDTDDGRAIYELFWRVKRGQEADGSWPGADTVAVLAEWLASCGFDISASAPDLS